MIQITEKALSEIKRVMKAQEFDENTILDVNVLSGGCSGFQYSLSFKQRSEIDPLNTDFQNFDGLDVSVNRRAGMYLEGTTIDYHEDLNQRGFTFDNPAAKSCCGCGNSFRT